MSILTNRLKVNFHIDAIERDFVFIRFKRDKNGKWWGAEELDCIIGDDYQAMSVGYAQYAYAMFDKKSNDTYALLQKLKTDPKFASVSAIEVKSQAVYTGNDECICEVTLARLLINSLGSSRSKFKHLHFSNLTGALLKVPPLKDKLYDAIGVAEITLSSDESKKNEFLLKVSVPTYRKKVSILKEYKGTAELKKILKRPEYVFHSGTGTLRRWLPSDGKDTDPTKSYIKCKKQGEKRHTNFLEFGSIEKFEKSRAGILFQVFNSIQEYLCEYMSVNFSTLEIDRSIELQNTLLKSPKQLHSKLDGQAIHIVDRVNDEDSTNLVITLKEFLLPYITDEKLITVSKRDKENTLNFRIIHDAEFYEKRGQKDEYLPSTDKFQRQNLTIESTKNVSKPIVKTIIKEQLIKRDVSSRTLNLFDWGKLQLKGIWTFAAWDEDTDHVIFMEIQPNGNFEFYEIDGQDILLHWQKFDKYRKFMTAGSSGDKIETLEGLVISDAGDINQIFITDEISIPDLSKIEAILKEVETELPEDKGSGDELADIVEEFLQEASDLDVEKLKLFSSELRKIGNQPISKRDFKRLLAQYLGTTKKVGDKNIDVSSTSEAIRFRDYLLDKHEIRLKFPQDNQSKEDLFDASLNIKYFGETEKEAYYLVGDRRDNVQFHFKDACHLRKIVAVNGSKLIFRQLLETMDVDFVRTGQSTVIPFPFKYIREYKNFGVAK
ncbi:MULTISPECIES: hypothetical protein [unclassified Nostoc]|uniref:hypothetical protein n=1 Tax=unclassified Nostoc TaxID=2593658 RepID=UPI0025AAF539|nr:MULTISPECIES: hypothetical protein [unclassified Nostoc]MDM9585012.1 hypothetical protein [Nostoc sp. GT001]MDZ7944235.1 hypothetical protein [Nostoc sp. EfeVER01]MDZ7994937.1 hypothetical protein [Nostoc sp. EspVER01]